MTLQSGGPYDVTLGRDLFGDTLTNARPAFASGPGADSCAHRASATSTRTLPDRPVRSAQLPDQRGDGFGEPARRPYVWLRRSAPAMRPGDMGGGRGGFGGGGPGGGGGPRGGGGGGMRMGPGGRGGSAAAPATTAST